MRISDLSRASGVPLPTLKFYLRDGLLAPGRATAPNQAEYDAGHLRRVRLIRVLVEVGGLSLAGVRGVLAALDQTERPLHDVLAAAHTALRRDDGSADDDLAPARAEMDAWLDRLGWRLDPRSPARDDVARALLALRRLGWDLGPEAFRRYAEHADAMAREEIEYVAATDDPEAAVEATVIGTVVFERALVALRRLAQEHHSRSRFGDGGLDRR
jgi:DNA-binding transcriptional MerR regulator